MARSTGQDKRASERQCAVTRQRRAPADLLRFALGPEGEAVPDLKARLPGRGVWLTCARDVVDKAVKSHVFDRAFRRQVKAPEGLAGRVEELLVRDALQRLSLANKAGLVVCGFEKVAAVLRKGARVLVHASDAAPDGCRKLDRLARARENGPQAAPTIVRDFNAEQLGLALGRPNVVHAALIEGAPSGKFLDAAARLVRFRSDSAACGAAGSERHSEDGVCV